MQGGGKVKMSQKRAPGIQANKDLPYILYVNQRFGMAYFFASR